MKKNMLKMGFFIPGRQVDVPITIPIHENHRKKSLKTGGFYRQNVMFLKLLRWLDIKPHTLTDHGSN